MNKLKALLPVLLILLLLLTVVPATAEEAENLKDCAREAIDSLNARDPWICDISASFGIYAAVPQKDDTLDQYMTLADRKMYEEKNSRKFGRRKEDLKINNEKG